MSTRIRTCLQKCVYWAELAVANSATYYLTAEWRRAVRYAREAKSLAEKSTDNVAWSELERRILQRGYPIISYQNLFGQDDVSLSQPLPTPAYYDPLEMMQQKLADAEQKHHDVCQRMQSAVNELHTQNEKMAAALAVHERTVKDLHRQIEQLKSENTELREELRFSTRAAEVRKRTDVDVTWLQNERSKYEERCRELEQSLDACKLEVQNFQTLSHHAVSLFTDEQRERFKQYLVD